MAIIKIVYVEQIAKGQWKYWTKGILNPGRPNYVRRHWSTMRSAAAAAKREYPSAHISLPR